MSHRQIPHLIDIDFVTPSDEAICLHEAGHACVALVVGIIPELVEFVEDGHWGTRSRIPVGNDQQRRLVACAAYVVGYNLCTAGRFTDAGGNPIDQKPSFSTRLRTTPRRTS